MNPAVERNARNLAVSLSFYGRVSEVAGVALITAPVKYSVFNIGLLAAPVAEGLQGEFARRVGVARDHFEGLNAPWSFWVCEDYLSRRDLRQMHRIFRELGLEPIGDPPGMELPDFAPPRRALPEPEMRQVADAETREGFAQLAQACFRLPAGFARAAYGSEEAWRHPLSMWTAWEGGRAVASAATVAAHGALGIYSVGTLPELRGRGYAEAVMRKAVAEARAQGAQGPLVLQSSPAGLNLYRKLGFRTTTRYAVFATPEATR
jgi:ribosomal protein S18 acetylase RimI-like enzyme